MNKTMKIILGLSALAAGAALTAGAVILAKSGKLSEIMENFKKEENEGCSLLHSGEMTKRKLRKIAKDLNHEIHETSGRISSDNHNKLQNEYEKMSWGQKLFSKGEMN